MPTFHTSGTTAPPTAFTVTPEMMAARVKRAREHNGEGFEDCKSLYCDLNPESHSSVRWLEYCMTYGVKFYMPLPSIEENIAQFDKVDCYCGSPVSLLRYVRAGLKRQFKHMIVSNSPMTAEQSKEIRAALGDNLWFKYSNSELGGTIAIGRAIDTVEKIPGCVGKPVIDVKLVDGCVWVKADGMATDHAPDRVKDGWLNTQDRASMTDDGMLVLEPRGAKGMANA